MSREGSINLLDSSVNVPIKSPLGVFNYGPEDPAYYALVQGILIVLSM